MFKRLFWLVLFIIFYLWRLSSLPQLAIPERQTVKIVGRVTTQPYLKGSYQIINLGNVLVRTNRFPGYFYGERLIIVGRFEKRVINPFLVQYFAFFPTIQKIEDEENFSPQRSFIKFLLKTRGQIEKNLSQLLPEPQASLLLGVVFGVKKQMPENFWQNLRKTGTLHLVVASGQNVVIISGFLMNSLVFFLKRRMAILITLLTLVAYVFLVGAEPPAIRAGLMAGMILLGQFLGREGDQGKFLLLTAMIIILISPLMLFDIGFQLSFAATAGLIWIYPILRKKTFYSFSENFDSVSDSLGKNRSLVNELSGARKVKSHKICWTRRVLNFMAAFPLLGESFLVTISAQLATLPILLVNFGQFSWLSPLVNILVLPIIPSLMALGLALSVLSFVSRFFSQVLAWFLWPLLTWFVGVVNWFGHWSWISWEVGKLSGWWAGGYYLFLIFMMNRRRFLARVFPPKTKIAKCRAKKLYEGIGNS